MPDIESKFILQINKGFLKGYYFLCTTSVDKGEENKLVKDVKINMEIEHIKLHKID